MKHKRVTMGSRMDLLELARHLRQEYLFISSERQHLQKLNEKVMRTVEHLYHLTWIAKQQRVNLDNLILSHSDSHPAACCQRANALANVNFVDSYKQLGVHDSVYADFLQQFREDPKLVAMCLSAGEKINIESMHTIVNITMTAIYGNCIMPEDEVYVLKLLKELMVLQLAASDNPRRLLRHGSCAFSRVYKTFSEGLFSAKLFLTAALHEPIMHLLMEDDLFLDIDPSKAAVRFPPEERLRHFGEEGTPEYVTKLQDYRNWTINKLVNLSNLFIKGIRNNLYCFPQSLSWLVRQMYNLVMKAKRVEVREVGIMCADLVFAFFICPAIVNPEPYGITDAPISYIACFNLMQVAHILQVLAMSKWEEIDPKLMDLYGKFEKDCMSSLLDLILEGSTDDSPSDLMSQFHELTRSAVLITESELASLVLFLREVQKESKDEVLKKTLGALLANLPSAPICNGVPPLSGSPLMSSPTSLVLDTPPHTPSMKRSILGKVSRKGSKASMIHSISPDPQDDHSSSVQEVDGPMVGGGHLEDVLVVALSGADVDCPGMLSEEKVLSLEQQKKQNKVRMNLDSLAGEEGDSVTSGPETVEKRTRFSLSQDQESIGTSDNLEAISEAASNHSVASSLDLENENDENENDNLSDMVSANVSGRGTPNVSGRDTPSSQLEGEEREQRPLDLPVTTHKQNQEDIEDKFGRFEIKPMIEGDETKSMVSDTWSTDVLASDSETVEQSDMSSQVALETQPPGLLDASETASQSDAWSTDVLASDTERLQDLDTDDTASVARSDDTTRSEAEGDQPSGIDISRTETRELGDDDVLSMSDPGHGFGIIPSTRPFDTLPTQKVDLNQMIASFTAGQMPSPQVQVTIVLDHAGDGLSVNADSISLPQNLDFEALDSQDTSSNGCNHEPIPSVPNDAIKIFDPLSVDVGTVHNGASTHAVQDDLTPTGTNVPYPTALHDGSLLEVNHIGNSHRETVNSMQSLGRLSLAVKELPNSDDQERASLLLDTLQDSAVFTSQSSSSGQRHRSSLADILSLDLTKTLNLHTENANAQDESKNVGNSFREFDIEILGEKPPDGNDVNSSKLDNQFRCTGSGSTSNEKIIKRTSEVHNIGDECSPRLSVSSTSSSNGSTDVCVRNAKESSSSSALSQIDIGDHSIVPDSSVEQKQQLSTSLPSTGAIPKSISFDKLVARGVSKFALQESQDSDDRGGRGDKHRKSFFKLSSFKFTFKGRNRKSHPGERHDSVDRVSVDSSQEERSVTYRHPQRLFSEELRSSQLEAGDEILAKYRKKPSSGILESTTLSVSNASDSPANVPDGVLEDDPQVFDSVNIDNSLAFADAKRKLRLVLGSADFQTMPWLDNHQGRSQSSCGHKLKDNELVAFLKVLLAEAINLQQRPLIAHLHEALRCVRMFDDTGCQKLFRSLREDYHRRAPYIAYLVRCRQGLLSTLAHLEAVLERIERDKQVCNQYLVAICVRMFLEKQERGIQLFICKFKALTVSDEKAQLVEKFLHYLFSAMETDPMWQTANEVQVEHAQTVIERTVMSQIYIHALYPNGDGDVLRDQVLHQHMQKLSNVITPNHKDLRIPKVYHHECPWPSAQAELRMINAYKTPRDKILCVLWCCSTIMNLLSMANDKSVPAADDFMPVLVYVLIKANPLYLLSTVQYVNTFYEKQLEGEEAYWWTQFCSAVEFIKTMDY